MDYQKRPREYAIDVLGLGTKEERQAYLQNSVPEQFQEWVKKYVSLWWPKRKQILESVKNERAKRQIQASKRKGTRRRKVATRYK